MPHFFEKYHLKVSREQDRRVKISDAMRKTIIKRYYADGISQRQIAMSTGVSRRMVSFILFPEKYEKARQQYKERRLDGRYYNKEKNKMAIQKTREYKKSLKFMIPKEHLKLFSWYKGEGRNGNVGLWDGKHFYIFGRYYASVRPYFEAHHGDGGTFKPFKKI